MNNPLNRDGRRQQQQQQQPEPPQPPQSLSTTPMFRRAKDIVQESDVPFLLQIPHTNSDVIQSIMTQCYGLIGKSYDTIEQLEKARTSNIVDNYYVSSHNNNNNNNNKLASHFGGGEQQHFHFLSTPHYREGAALLTRQHKGRLIFMMDHPCTMAENQYLSHPTTRKKLRGIRDGRSSGGGSGSGGSGSSTISDRRADLLQGLVEHVNSTRYYDNWMTRMLAEVPPDEEVTEEHYRNARMILENKFLIGMASDLTETVIRRLGLYFGWKEERKGCAKELINESAKTRTRTRTRSEESSPALLEEKGHEWRFVRARNHFDSKLYARGQAMFGNQKMHVPVHESVRKDDVEVVERAYFGHLRNVKDARDDSDIPFFW